MFALFGLVDYAEATGVEDAWALAHGVLAGARAGIPVVSRPGTYQAYDLEGRSNANGPYVDVHLHLVDALAAMTEDRCFRAAQVAWRLDALPP